MRKVDLEPRFVLSLFALLTIAWLASALLASSIESPLAGAASIVVLGGLAAVIAHHIVFKPLRQLVAAASAEVTATQVASTRHIAALDRLRHADRVAAVGTITSSVAHELGNPLNVIELRAQLIASSDAATLQEARHNARLIVEQSRRMAGVISRSLLLAPVQPVRLAQIDLLTALRTAIDLSQRVAQEHAVTIRLEAGRSIVPIAADFDKVVQAVVILLLNGVLAMPDGGALEVHVREAREPHRDAPDQPHGEYLCIDVIDTGPAIPEDALALVFDPLYSTRIPDGGAGLGLSVARAIAEQHRGWISVESAVGRGSSFTVHLPKNEPDSGEAHGN